MRSLGLRRLCCGTVFGRRLKLQGRKGPQRHHLRGVALGGRPDTWGRGWTPTNIASLQVRIYKTGGNTLRVDLVQVTVEYSPLPSAPMKVRSGRYTGNGTGQSIYVGFEPRPHGPMMEERGLATAHSAVRHGYGSPRAIARSMASGLHRHREGGPGQL